MAAQEGRPVAWVRLLAFRLYLSAQVLLTGAAALFILWWVTTELHDRHVAKADLACFSQRIEAFTAAEKTKSHVLSGQDDEWSRGVPVEQWDGFERDCRVKSGSSSFMYSARAWRGTTTGRKDRDYGDDLPALAIALLAPILLYGTYRWVRWLARPPQETA